MEYITLSNGVKMPTLGYGVFLVSPDECERCVSDALSVGYRLIDTAQAYQNEEGVGNAWRKSGLKREDLFLVTKVWISNNGEEKAAKSIDESLRKLQTEYIDLLLIHQAYGDVFGTWRAMEKAGLWRRVRHMAGYGEGLSCRQGACHRCEQLPGRTLLRLCPLCRCETDGEPVGMQHPLSADRNRTDS